MIIIQSVQNPVFGLKMLMALDTQSTVSLECFGEGVCERVLTHSFVHVYERAATRCPNRRADTILFC